MISFLYMSELVHGLISIKKREERDHPDRIFQLSLSFLSTGCLWEGPFRRAVGEAPLPDEDEPAQTEAF